MGFEVQKRTASLTFKDTDYDGAEIKVALEASMGFFLDLQTFTRETETLTADNMQAMYKKFGYELLVSWDLELKGKALPADGEGMMAIPAKLANIIISTWLEAVAQPPDPLSSSSNGGKQSEEAIPQKAKR